jgi:hypothetical protein
MTDRIRTKLAMLEARLREQTERRDQAQFHLNESMQAILQLQGAIITLKELLTPEEVPDQAAADG